MNDPSHPDTPATQQVEPDELNVGLIAVVGTFIGVVVLLVVVLLEAWF